MDNVVHSSRVMEVTRAVVTAESIHEWLLGQP